MAQLLMCLLSIEELQEAVQPLMLIKQSTIKASG
jgi:hypothetical protein